MKKIFLILLIVSSQLINCNQLLKKVKLQSAVGIVSGAFVLGLTYKGFKAWQSRNAQKLEVKFANEKAYNKAAKEFSDAVKSGNPDFAVDVFNKFARENGMGEFSDMDSFLKAGEQSMKANLTGEALTDFETRIDMVKASVGLPTLKLKLDNYIKNIGGSEATVQDVKSMIEDMSTRGGYSKDYIIKNLHETDLYKNIAKDPAKFAELQKELKAFSGNNKQELLSDISLETGRAAAPVTTTIESLKTLKPTTVLQELDPAEIAARNERYAESIEAEQSGYQPIEDL